ncbi:hypothetical protein B0H13DRAFT_2558689 [Mycena leptocephala]|nr:hypothetical protein B0H13DRAFT_2558689 [Mycena leptocephala]
MLLECTECQLPYYNYEDLEEHYAVTHPKIHRLNNRLDVRIIKRMLNRHQKTYRCPTVHALPHPNSGIRTSNSANATPKTTPTASASRGRDAHEARIARFAGVIGIGVFESHLDLGRIIIITTYYIHLLFIRADLYSYFSHLYKYYMEFTRFEEILGCELS